MKQILIVFAILVCAGLGYFLLKPESKVYHYYSTVADERHFPMLLSLVGSIHKADFDALDEIAVFDIGLNEKQIAILGKIEKVNVYQIEKTNPDILTYFETNSAGREVRGWFSWKPVVFKQSLDKFPYFLYLDSGTLVLNSPDNLFKHIKENGCFIIEISPHSIQERITRPVVEKVVASFSPDQQEMILSKDTPMIDAGCQGISRDVWENYVKPIYEHSADLTLFADDGSSQMGFGAGRHDQTLFSIYANLEKLRFNNQGWSKLQIEGEDVPFHMHWDRSEVNAQTVIYRSRKDVNYGGSKLNHIHWRAKE